MRASFVLAAGLLAALAATAQPAGVPLTGGLSRTSFDGDRLALLGETYSAFSADALAAPVDLLPAERTHPVGGLTGRHKKRAPDGKPSDARSGSSPWRAGLGVLNPTRWSRVRPES